MVEEELEFPLENGYTLFEEVHDYTTWEPTYEKKISFLMEVHVLNPMNISHDEKFSLSNPLGELVLSPTSYTRIVCSTYPNEVWVKFFFMVPDEEYGIPIYPFDDDMTRVTSYLHLQQHPCLHYYYTHLHGCTYDVHLSHLETHDFHCSLLGPFDVGGNSSKDIIIGRKILCYFTMVYIFMNVLMSIL